MKTIVEKTNEEILTKSQRWAGLTIVGAMLLLCGFFAYHQFANTGFFTAAFGSAEMFSLYGPILLSFAAPVIRALSGRKNSARPFEAATSLFLAMGSLWLFIVFPFNFSHLADILPGVIRIILSWITNDIGRLVLILQVIIGAITALLTILKYFSIRRKASVA
jgi:hypothetical protein